MNTLQLIELKCRQSQPKRPEKKLSKKESKKLQQEQEQLEANQKALKVLHQRVGPIISALGTLSPLRMDIDDQRLAIPQSERLDFFL